MKPKTISKNANQITFSSFKNNQLEKTLTTRITGVPLDAIDNNEQSQYRKRLFFPIVLGCVCVQDTPQNPCPCYSRPPIIVWLLKDDIIKSGKTNALNHDGQELYFFELKNQAMVQVETMIPTAVTDLTRETISGCNCQHHGSNRKSRSPLGGTDTASATCNNLENLISFYETINEITWGMAMSNSKFAKAYNDAKNMYNEVGCHLF
jgi:hypothetical protein